MTGIEIPSGKLNGDDVVPDASVDEGSEGSKDRESGDDKDEDEEFVDEKGNKPEAKKDAPAELTAPEGQQEAETSK